MTRTSNSYQEAYEKLNDEQREAVNTIEGPVLVIAGPGTGKTQLLGTRVGRILETTDSAPENILCLTFSEAATDAMQHRLNNLIGSDAYRITVSTFHGFGNDLINRYPELFTVSHNVTLADELTSFKLLRTILGGLAHDNPLRSEYFTKDLLALFGSYKKAMISPDILESICRANLEFIKQATGMLDTYIKADTNISHKQLPDFIKLAAAGKDLPEEAPYGIISLKTLWQEELESAITVAESTGKMTALSQWKSNWLIKNSRGHKVPKGEIEAKKHLAAADIFRQYLDKLQTGNYIDYDDMIINAVTGLKTNLEVLYEIQERYQYILVDEFQDTNAAQLELIELILNNPVNEGRPNILAVGDDNQSVYKFQGAHYSQMERFYKNYRNVKLINLITNYRSSLGIVSFSNQLRSQIQDGLKLPQVPAVASEKRPEILLRIDLPQRQDQLAWTAEQIDKLIQKGLPAQEIAVLSTKHRLLQDFLPYLHARRIPANYVLNENLLDDPRIEAIINMAQLAIHLDKRSPDTDFYWQRVLSYDFWELPTSTIWDLSWKKHSGQMTEQLVDNQDTRRIAWFFIRLSQIAAITPIENGLNYLTGIESLKINQPELQTYQSPYLEFYLKSLKKHAPNWSTDEWQLFNRLEILRDRLPDNAKLPDLVTFYNDCRDAEIRIDDKTYITENDQAVTLTTAHGSKGLEFETVILLDTCEDVWGKSAHDKTSSIALPINLRQLRQTSTADDRLRLLFVAASRAKTNLIMPSYLYKHDGKPTKRLANLAEKETPDGIISPFLPKGSQIVEQPDMHSESLLRTTIPWYSRHFHFEPELTSMLAPRLNQLRLSPTMFNDFIDVSNGGPQNFFMKHILNFHPSQTADMLFGSVMHETLDWQFKQTINKHPPKRSEIIDHLQKNIEQYDLTDQEKDLLIARGKNNLKAFLDQTTLQIHEHDLSEYKFANEQILLDNVRLSGKIDRLVVNQPNSTLQLIDFKTGKPYVKWTGSPKAYLNARQLYFYRIMLDHSNRFKKYHVDEAAIYFLEPDNEGNIQTITLQFDDNELGKMETLIRIVWEKIQALDFPETSHYQSNLSGIKAFEKHLLKKA